MKRLITLEWEIHDTRDENRGFRTGTSKLITHRKTYKDAINDVIAFAENLPTCELERNNIDLEEYREYPICRYYYETKLSKILDIESAE